MLTQLNIKNYALIESLEINPHASFNIITGETGAGKSIMLGAIGLLLGNRADLKALLNKENKCIIEADFDVWSYNLQSLFEELDIDYEDKTTLRREITPSGKSRSFVNDSPVTLDILKKIGTRLLDVHSQHDNLQLRDNLFQLQIVDAYAQNSDLLQDYKQHYTRFRLIQNQYKQLEEEYQTQKNELDYNSFLLDELHKANFQEGEQTQLESESKLLDSAEEVKSKLSLARVAFTNEENSVLDTLATVKNALLQISELSVELGSISQRLESAFIELQDISSEVEREEDNLEFDPERAMEVQNRLSLLYNLQQKHQVGSLEELLERQQELEQKVNKVLNFDEELSKLKQELDEANQELQGIAQKLSEKRKSVLMDIEQEVKGIVADLGMPNATIEIEQKQIEPTSEGIDYIRFLFSANKGIAPQEIEKVASGGEFSRLMLAIKSILAGKTALPTIIFDEIDTGISGEVAVKMGDLMKELSYKHQIMAISHLHQIAAKGDIHYFVYKDNSSERTISRMKQLSQEERIQEIAQMISGSAPSESAIINAKELLAMG